MARKIVITSGKGGVGKTTICASLGMELARLGQKVLMIDADVGLNNLDVITNIESNIVYDMADVLEGRCRIKQALLEVPNVENLYILPSQHAYFSEDIGAKNFRLLINRLDSGFDFILIDCPAGIEKGFHRAVSASTEALVVTTPHISAIRDADKVIGLLASYKINEVNIIVNRVRGDMVLTGDMMDGMTIAKILKNMPIGIVPEDDNLGVYSQLGKLESNDSVSHLSFEFIADNILTGKRKLFDCTANYRGLFGKIKLKLKRGIL
ncbi:MAG: septum site-determining protein MinD [Clostridia bacterium]